MASSSMVKHIAEGRIPLPERKEMMKVETDEKSKNTGSFSLRGNIFPYLRSFDQNAAYNELSVEIPVTMNLYNKFFTRRILEFGNVLPMFHPGWNPKLGESKAVYPHICVDPVSSTKGIVKRSIEQYEFPKKEKYDFIFSLLFFRKIERSKLEIAKEIITSMLEGLSRDGLMMITLPCTKPSSTGDNWIDIFMDNVRQKKRGASDTTYQKSDPDHVLQMNRMGYGMAGNKWKEVPFENGPDLPYEPLIPSTGTVYFLFWGNLDRYWR